MEYTYATCILNESGTEINEANLTAVLEAAGCQVQESRVKAIVAALEDVDIDGVTSVDPATVGAQPDRTERAAGDEESSEMDVVPPVDDAADPGGNDGAADGNEAGAADGNQAGADSADAASDVTAANAEATPDAEAAEMPDQFENATDNGV